MKPLISIVIANYNYGRYLEMAIRSVITQSQIDRCELIVIDGGSTDNSVETIKKYDDRISYWVSERDSGQSEAFNKGFSKARGKYLTWLNADDVMVAGCLERVVDAMEANPDCEWFTGNTIRVTNEGNVVELWWGPHFIPKWLQRDGRPIAVYGPTSFFSRRIFNAAGGMKLYQNFMMDTDLWMRFVMMGVMQRRVNCFCWVFRMHLESKTAEYGEHKIPSEQRVKFEAERKRAYEETGYRPSRLNRRLVQIWRLLDGSIILGFILKRKIKRYAI